MSLDARAPAPVADRFAEAERSRQYRIAMELPAPPRSRLLVLLPLVFLVPWLAINAVIASIAADFGPALLAVAIGMAAVGALLLLGFVVVAVRKQRAPVLRHLAVLVDKRADAITDRLDHYRHTYTRYYATLEFEGGDRLELPTHAGVAGLVAARDLGVAVMRAGELVDFHRIRL